MTASALPVSGLIQITLTITPNAAQAASQATALVLGSSAVIDVVQRLRTYPTLAAVGADFPTNSPEYLSATAWFGQKPQPTTLSIGRWAQTATKGTLIGGVLSSTQQLIATWNAITSGAFNANINGAIFAISGLNFAAAANLNGVAGDIATALNSASAGATAAWLSNEDYFQFTSGTTGTTSSFGFISSPAAVGDAVFSGQPSANDTLTIDGTAITFVAASPVGNQVLIGSSLTVTLQNLLTFLNASADVNLTKMTYSLSSSTLYIQAVATGTAGDSYTLAKSSTAITLSGGTLTGGSGTDISSMLEMTATSSGAYVANGIAAETALAAVQLFDSQFAGQWYALCVPQAADSDHLAIAAYIESDAIAHMYGITTQEAGTLSSVSTTDLAYLLSQQLYDHTCIQYSSTSPYAIMSYLGRLSTVNYLGSNTAITLMYKQEPGITAETLTPTQAGTLQTKNCNVYVYYNINTGNGSNTPIIQYGVQCSGHFTDLIAFCDWFKGQLQANSFTTMFSANKVPQTDPGMTQIANQAIVPACNQAVTSGYIAPGTWNSAGFGALNTGDTLKTGFYIYQPTVASQPQANRQARISVPFQVALKSAGAVQDIAIAVQVNQ